MEPVEPQVQQFSEDSSDEEMPSTPAAAGDPDVVVGVEPDAAPEGRNLLELWSDREEVHALPEILRPAEAVVCVGSGALLRSGHLAQSHWLVVLTDRRLLCIRGRSPVTRKVIEMPVSAIRSVDRSGLFRSTLAFDTGYGTLRITGLKKQVALELVEGLETLMRSLNGDNDFGSVAAIPKADLSRGSRSADERVAKSVITQLAAELQELRDRVTFLEELVRANVAR